MKSLKSQRFYFLFGNQITKLFQIGNDKKFQKFWGPLCRKIEGKSETKKKTDEADTTDTHENRILNFFKGRYGETKSKKRDLKISFFKKNSNFKSQGIIPNADAAWKSKELEELLKVSQDEERHVTLARRVPRPPALHMPPIIFYF